MNRLHGQCVVKYHRRALYSKHLALKNFYRNLEIKQPYSMGNIATLISKFQCHSQQKNGWTQMMEFSRIENSHQGRAWPKVSFTDLGWSTDHRQKSISISTGRCEGQGQYRLTFTQLQKIALHFQNWALKLRVWVHYSRDWPICKVAYPTEVVRMDCEDYEKSLKLHTFFLEASIVKVKS